MVGNSLRLAAGMVVLVSTFAISGAPEAVARAISTRTSPPVSTREKPSRSLVTQALRGMSKVWPQTLPT
jgi:hypothetical protein